MFRVSRRKFLAACAAPGFTPALAAQSGGGKRPVIICAANGYEYLEPAYQALRGGTDTLDAALLVVQGPENDPKGDSVGLGGLIII